MTQPLELKLTDEEIDKAELSSYWDSRAVADAASKKAAWVLYWALGKQIEEENIRQPTRLIEIINKVFVPIIGNPEGMARPNSTSTN